jgi:hypothetical protein
VPLEVRVLRGDDRLPQPGRDRFVRDDDTPLRRELADEVAAGAIDANAKITPLTVPRNAASTNRMMSPALFANRTTYLAIFDCRLQTAD